MKKEVVKILYVEDDVNLGFVTKDNLEFHGYSIVYCKEGNAGLYAFKKDKIDICIIDVMLPGMDGFTLAREIRKIDSEIPIIFLTAKTMKEDKIAGFKTGADDYITKPFSVEELMMRIEVFLKRSKIGVNKAESRNVFRLGAYMFDFNNLTLTINKHKTILTLKEAELLRFFCLNLGKILKREEILKAIWGDDDYFMGRSLDVFISRLRKYLKKDAALTLENIHSVGFRMSIQQD
jgi:DNA-binding response OmpR family regulator